MNKIEDLQHYEELKMVADKNNISIYEVIDVMLSELKKVWK